MVARSWIVVKKLTIGTWSALLLLSSTAAAEQPRAADTESWKDACLAECAEAYFETVARCPATWDGGPTSEALDPDDLEIQEEVCKLLAAMAYHRCELRCNANVGT